MRCCLENKIRIGTTSLFSSFNGFMYIFTVNCFDLLFITYFVNDFIHHDCLVGALLLMNVECILLNSINDLNIASVHMINQVITMIK